MQVGVSYGLLTVLLGVFFLSLFSNVVSAVGTYPAVDPSMVLYYHFNNQSAYGENSTFVYDFSGNGNNATNYNSTSFITTSLLNDYSMYFNSSNEQYFKVNDANSLDIIQNISISFWINRKSNQPASQFILAKEGAGSTTQWDVIFDSNNRLNFRAGGSNGILLPLSDNLSNDIWHYVVIVANKNETGIGRIYVDGVLRVVNSTFISQNTEWNRNSFPIWIGRRQSFAVTSHLNDTYLDELVIYNRILTESEIWGYFHNYLSCLDINNYTILQYESHICRYSYLNKRVTINYNNTNIDLNLSNLSADTNINGITLNSVNNITIRNGNFYNYTYAISANNVNNVNISNNNIDGTSNGWLLLDNIHDSYISNNNFGYNSNPTISGVYLRYNITNVLINSNIFYNCTSDGCIKVLNKHDKRILNITKNILNGPSSKLITIRNSTSISMEYNILSNSYSNFDSYNVGIHIFDNSSEINIDNNNITNIGCTGILTQGVNNITITGNYFAYNITDAKLNNANCGYESPSAIDLASIWKTWLSDGTESMSDNITKINMYSAKNIAMNNNIFVGFPILLRASDPINLSHNLSNYWYRRFTTVNYLLPEQDYYISNSFNNVSTTFNESNNNPVIIRDLLGTGYPGYSAGPQKTNFRIYKNYLYVKDVNETQIYSSSVFNLTSPRIYNSTLSSGTIITNQEANLTLAPNKEVYISDASWV